MKRKIGRNAPCPCGSGNKYKRCCLRSDQNAGGESKAEESSQAFKDALEKLVHWSKREIWVELRAQILMEHIAAYYEVELEELDPEQVFSELAPELLETVTLFAFEDFFSCRFDPNGVNIIDDFLKRKAVTISPSGRAYLEALRDSAPGFYEVVDTVPGQSVTLHDLMRGGRTLVTDKVASVQMLKGIVIACRILHVGTRAYMGSGIYGFPHKLGRMYAQDILKVCKKQGWKLDGKRSSGSAILMDVVQRNLTPMISALWISSIMDGPGQNIMNDDGEPLECTEVRLDLAQDSQGKVQDLLARSLDFIDGPDDYTWDWVPLGKGGARQMLLPGIPPRLEDQPKGRLRLEEDVLVLETNSAERAERGKSALTRLLRSLVADSTIRSLEPELENEDNDPAHEFSNELQKEILEEYRDLFYKSWMDKPFPLLGNKTPREAAKTSKGRAELMVLLREVEQSEVRQARMQGLPPYDCSWMWDQLGLSPSLREIESKAPEPVSEKIPEPKQKSTSDDLLLLKVIWSDRQARVRSRPFRVLSVPSGVSLYKLAEGITSAFGFYFDHPFGFYDNLKAPSRSQEGYELFTDMGQSMGFKGVKRTKAGSVFTEPKKKMLFLFDYGDEWRFIVQLKGTKPLKGKHSIEVIDSRGEPPDQYGWGDDESWEDEL